MEDSDSDFELDQKNKKTTKKIEMNQTDDLIDKENEDLIKKVNEYIKNKVFVFEGYRDLDGNELFDDESYDDDDHTPNEIKKELVKCIIQGDLFKLDDLLHSKDVNINTKIFSENLLMVAIKSNQEKIAEYLIANGIDLNHEAKFYEFGNEKYKSPFNYVKYSCRQLAYNRNMLKIVDLIDIFDNKTDRRIRNVLAKRFLKENFLNMDKQKQNNDSKSYFSENFLTISKNTINKEELIRYLLSDEANYLQMRHQNEEEGEENSFKTQGSEDKNDGEDITITESSLSYLSNDTLSKDGYLQPRKYRKVDNISKQVMKQIEDNPNTKSFFQIENEHLKKKCLEYRGYKINLYINKHHEEVENDFKSKSLGLDFGFKEKNSSRLSNKSNLDMRKIYTSSSVNEIKSIHSVKNKSRFSSRSDSDNLKLNDYPIITPDLLTSSRSNNGFFEKRHKNQKDLLNINNHNYLQESTSIRLGVKELIHESLNKYNTPLFPLRNLSIKKQAKNQQSKTNINISKNNEENKYLNINIVEKRAIDKNLNKTNLDSLSKKQISLKVDVNENSVYENKFSSKVSSSFIKNYDKSQREVYKKTPDQILNTYLLSLKKSGLINNNCFPIINKRYDVTNFKSSNKQLTSTFTK